MSKVSKQYLFCCFVDLKSAFDTISKKKLIYKLIQAGVGGNVRNVIHSMYSEVSYVLKLDTGCSDKLYSNVGVKQGCVLSPLLFNLFLRLARNL